MDGVLESVSAKTRNTLSSILRIENAMIGNLTGIGLILSDMFGLGVGLQAGDLLTISDATINIKSETDTVTNATMSYAEVMGDSSSKVSFIMVKEGNDWFIEDMR